MLNQGFPISIDKKISGGSSDPKGIFVGTITNGGSFPTTRPDGSTLINEDYVKPASTATFPFTINGITFTSSRDKALYINGTWFLEPGAIQKTGETPASDKSTESLSGTATNQSSINIENKTRLNKVIETITKDNNKLVFNQYNSEKIEVDDMVFKTNTIEIENKTIDADKNTIKNLETDNFKTLTIRTSDIGFQTTPDDTHLVSEKLVYNAIEDSKRGFIFKGYISPTEPTGTIKNNELWYNSSSKTMPTTFPISVKRYMGVWSSTTENYTPTSMDLWANKNNDHGYYWFGNSWNIIDTTTDPDNITIDTNTAGQIQVKDGGISIEKLKTQLATDKGKTFVIDDDGTWKLGETSGGVIIVDALPTLDIKDNSIYRFNNNFYQYDSTNTKWLQLTQTLNTTTGFTENAKIWKGTKAEYDAITVKDSNTIYLITDEASGDIELDDITINKNSDEKVQVKDGGLTKAKTSDEFWKNNNLKETTNAENIVVSGDLTCDGDTTIANGTVSGELDVPTPTSDNMVANKKYVDDNNGGVIVVASLPTTDIKENNIYRVNDNFYQYDATNTKWLQFTQTINTATGFTENSKIWKGTKTEYDAITTKDNNTIYLITDEDVEIKIDNITIDKNASNELEVKDGGLEVKHIKADNIDTTATTSSTNLINSNAVFKEELKNSDSEFTYNSYATKDTLGIKLKNNNDDVKIEKEIDFGDKIVFQDKTQAISNKTIDADLNTISNIDKGNLKTQATTDAGKSFVIDSDGTWKIGEVGEKVKVDDITIEKGTDDKLQVKDGGISKDKVNSEFFKDNTLIGNTSINNLEVATSCIVPTPTSDTQATTKLYVDNRVSVSNTGTATDTIKYITIGGTESKIYTEEVKADNITIEKLADNSLGVKDDGITFAKLDNDMVSDEIPTSDPSAGKIPTEKAVFNAINDLKTFTYICSTDSSQSSTPFSNYIYSAQTSGADRCKINAGYICRVGRVYQLQVDFCFTSAKATWAANTEWLNLFLVKDPFKAVCVNGFDSSFGDPSGGNYGGSISYRKSGTSIGIWPWKQIPASSITTTLFRASALWIN